MPGLVPEFLIAAAIVAAYLAYFARRSVLHRESVSPGVGADVGESHVCALVGLLLGGSGAPWLSGLGDAAALASLFFAGWVGFYCGCCLDLRLLRPGGGSSLLPGLYQFLFALVLVPLSVYAVSKLPGVNGDLATPASTLILAAVCIAGPSLTRERRSSFRAAHRREFQSPSLSPIAAIATLGMASALLPASVFELIVPLSQLSQGFAIKGVATILWGVVLGCAIGLFCDLTSREYHPDGHLFFILATFTFVGAGLSEALGLQPLWVGAFAGIWLINCTLRRLDILRVAERGRSFVRFGLPLALGWLLGDRLQAAGIDWEAFAVTLAVVLLLRPAVEFISTNVARLLSRKTSAASPYPGGDLHESEQLSLLAASMVFKAFEGGVGAGVLAGVFAGYLVLNVVAARSSEGPDARRSSGTEPAGENAALEEAEE